MKTCSSCRESKPVTAFGPHKKSRDGLAYYCNECCRKRVMEYRNRHPDRTRESDQRKRIKHAEKIRQRKLHYRTLNSAKVAAGKLRWARANKDRVNARVMARNALKLQATPSWSIQFFVDEAYELAALRTRLTGIEWHVDHVVPLRNPIVCGLHAHTNLQVVPAAVNCAKKNRYWPDMPEPQGDSHARL